MKFKEIALGLLAVLAIVVALDLFYDRDLQSPFKVTPIVTHPTDVIPEGTDLQIGVPLAATHEKKELCLERPNGFVDEYTDSAFSDSAAKQLSFTADLVLTDGKTIHLSDRGLTGLPVPGLGASSFMCVSAPQGTPYSSKVRAIRVFSTTPVSVPGVYWYTHAFKAL